jgi:hypothetical protein
MIASGLLDFRRCCSLKLDGKSQVENIPICVSLSKACAALCTIVAWPPTSACASPVYLAGSVRSNYHHCKV